MQAIKAHSKTWAGRPMSKALIAIATSLALPAAGTASAQIGKAALEATDAAQHKIDEKQADGRAANNVKSAITRAARRLRPTRRRAR
ncbi:hypothetical protein [Variovorax sp. OK212]|nr:hypothetical protein [Variovorax sp. OK212]